MKEALSIRIDPENPNHHLWKNGSTWWIHYTVLTHRGRQRRVRYSLRTKDLVTARVLRDAVFAAWEDGAERPSPAPLVLAPADDPPGAEEAGPRTKLRLLTRHPRIQVADTADGLPICCLAPDSRSVPRLARIDRGCNMLGTLADDFWVTTDDGWGNPSALVLWVVSDPSQMDDGVGRFAPIAVAPIDDFYDPEQGEVDMRAAGAHLLFAWHRHCVECSWVDEDSFVGFEGGELLDDATVEHVVWAAFGEGPLDLRGLGAGEG